jgi:hypothetical protein
MKRNKFEPQMDTDKHGFSNNMKYFVWLNEQQQGPFDEDAIQKMVSEGQISHETLLCPEGGQLDWTSAKDLFPPASPSAAIAETVSTNELQPATNQVPIASAEYQDNGTRLLIRLTSGMELKIKSIRLYDEVALSEINAKRDQVLKSFQGVSTGLGSIGSIGWVLATSVVIGAVEGALSAAAASSGTNLLLEVIRMEQKLRNEGVFIPVGNIENIEIPMPGLWRVPYKREVRICTGVNFWSEKQYENRQVTFAFIHSGDEFIFVRDEDDSIHSIRWSAIEHYIC